MKSKTVYVCTDCGNESPRWQGRCPACGAWNTLQEQTVAPAAAKTKTAVKPVGRPAARTLAELSTVEEVRFPTGLAELDRVLGGGCVSGSLVLVGGAPGIGKSTLLLQICKELCRLRKVFYASGEESEQQLKLRALRLGVAAEKLYVCAETDLSEVLTMARELRPEVLIVDSIQTMSWPENTSSPGSISQVKECTTALMQLAKGEGITVFVVGHVNKEGAIAGPRVLEHMVDTVLYFEGDRHTSYRLLRAEKNRFGSTNELGVFDMQDDGLHEVPNPSELLLSGRPLNASGTCVACVMEGSRPLLAEIQALVTRTSFNVPRRTTEGFDFNRAVLQMAVLEKRAGLKLSACDAYLNVVGGLTLDEPSADLPAVLAVASSYLDRPIDGATAAIGEVGLTGEVRAVSFLEQRLQELRRLGFRTVIVPAQGTASLLAPEGVRLIRVRSIREAIESVIPND